MKTMNLMNRIVFGILTVLTLLSAPAWAKSDEPRVITTTGRADVRIVPDEVVIRLGVLTLDMDLVEAKRLNDERTKAVLALAPQFSIAVRDVQTSHFTITPRYREDWNQKEFLGYNVNKTIVIKLKDLSKLDALTTAAVQAGANSISDIRFRSSELRKHRDEARLMAVRAAREKAEALAKELGQELGRPVTITENHDSAYMDELNSISNNYRYQPPDDADANEGQDDSVALGAIAIGAGVTVTFELK